MQREVITGKDARAARWKRVHDDGPIVALVVACMGALLVETALGVSLVVAWLAS